MQNWGLGSHYNHAWASRVFVKRTIAFRTYSNQTIPSTLTNFLKKKSQEFKDNAVNIRPPKITSFTPKNITSDFRAYAGLYKNHQDFLSKQGVPSHIRTDVLPQAPTDIKGVDDAVYLHIRRPKVSKTMPRVLRNQYFSLKFFPHDHHVSRFRKSNVAYTFSNKGGFKLNSRELENALNSYKGKYRAANYFRESLQPLHTAFGRTTYRKYIKQCLFESLHHNVKSREQITMVAGVFRFMFNEVPGTVEDKESVRNDIDKSVKKVLSPSFRKELKHATTTGNGMKREIEVLSRNANMTNTLAEWKIPGYFPKLPFLK